MEVNRRINLALISPNQNAYSETFIRFHRTHIDANVHFLYQETLPEMSEEGPLVRYHLFARMLRRVSKCFFPEYLNFHEKRISKYLKRHKIDVILAEFGMTGAEISRVAGKMGLPLLVHFHGLDAYMKDILTSYSGKYKRLFSMASGVFVVSNHMHRQLLELGCSPDKLILNPYGPDNRFFEVENAYDSMNFLAIGRFIDKKAPHFTIMAFKKVLEKYPSAMLNMVGDGPLLDKCKSLVKELDIEGSVYFPGVLDTEGILAMCSQSIAFLQHSRAAENGDSEGTPVAVLEAGASGLTVISTRHAGIPDVVIEGGTGFLVEEGDVEGMARCMLMILDNPGLAVRMGHAARERINEYFTLERHIDVLNRYIRRSVAH